jgi:ribosome maturation factor RimP
LPTFLFCDLMNQATVPYKEKIERLLLPAIEAENMELVDVECLRMKSRWLVRIYVDKAGGVTLDDCAHVSYQVGDILEVHDVPPGSFILEVSSPGLDRPLVKDGDFSKAVGRMVRVRLHEKKEGSRNFRGRLIGFDEEEGRKVLVLDVDGKEVRLPREGIAKANIEYEP